MLAVAAGLGAFESAADSVAPHPPLNTRAVYDEADGTVGIEWDRSVGALRYDVAASGTVVYSGGWDTGATLMASQGVQRYSVRACSTLCGDWTDPVSVNVAAAPPTGIRYGGGFSDIVWTHNAYQVPLVRYVPGEIGAARGAYRVSATATRLLGGSRTTVLWTAFESASIVDSKPLSGRFFIVSGTRSAVDRFSLAFNADAENRAVLDTGFFVATWDSQTGWQVRNNAGAA